ncbi:MAG: S8 family serine peptidase [Eubacterium sp.]
MKKRLSVLLSIIIVLSICAPLTSVMAEEARKQSVLKTGKEIAALCSEYDNYSNSNDGDKIDNRLIVKTDTAIDEYGAVDSVYGFGYAFLQYADEESAQKAKEKYEESGYTADYDCVVTSSSTYDKYNTNEEWAYEETDAVSALDYYKLKAKSNINIAVVDSGINYNHELFKNRIERTKVDFSTDASGDERDTSGHGTKVAGAIAKSTPSNVKLFAYKIFNKNLKGTSSEAVAALSYIKQLKNKPDIINCSFSTGSLGTVINELVDMGVTVVAAAGNDGKEVYQQPAIFDSVITVAATNQYGYAWSSSSYGSCVDISAPGVGVYTANFPGNNTYAQFAGTSMATPLVSAAAAYVLMEHRSYTPEQVKQEIIATATPFKKSDCYNDRYGAGIVNFSNIINGTRCKDVTANYISGAYRDSISVELKCANTLADIYYTTDGTLPSKTNGTKYTEPIKLTETTRITAVAFARAGTPFKSKFTYLDYYILKDGESEFIVDNYNCLKAYLGNDTNITIPDTIDGIEIYGIAKYCFKNSNIESVTLPDKRLSIEDEAFYGCKNLKNINLSKVTYIGPYAFANCTSLTDKADFSSVERVDETGLAYTYFKTINLPECTNIGQLAFEGSKAENIIFGKLERTSNAAFYNCSNLKKLYIPKVKSFSSNNTRSCNSIELIFAPSVKYLTLDVTHDINVYCDLLLSAQIENPSKYNCNIITQSYAPGLKDVDSSLYNHISSDDFGVSKAGEYRRSDAGLRFGFTFDSSKIGFDFNEFAQNTEYGFVYSYNDFSGVSDSSKKERLRANKSNPLIKSADNRIVDGTVSTYNAVFTDIPAESAADGISVRSYFCIDGMYFYSPVVTYSLSSVSDYSDNSEADNDIKYDHIHSYVKKNIGPFCVTKGYTMYECNGCGKSYIVDYIEPVGHKYKFVDAKNGLLNYQCPYCDNNITKSKSELPIFIDYVNTKAARGNDNMYLDLNNDGYINAKDYALLNKISN